MPNPLTVVDACGDELVVTAGHYLSLESEDSEVHAWDFGPNQKDKVRQIRDLLTEWLGENAGELRGVRASEVSFNEGILRLAAVHEQPVTFRYAKGDGSHIEQRTLLPESLFSAKDGSLLVAGQDPDRDEYRAYRVDRIKGEVTAA